MGLVALSSGEESQKKQLLRTDISTIKQPWTICLLFLTSQSSALSLP